MSVLMLAFGLYLVGVAAMLVLRPSFMFRESGTWKEFGLANTATYTVFPFWMFTIVWAVVSYCIAMLCMVFFVSALPATAAIPPANNLTNATPTIAEPISAAAAPALPQPVPPIPAATVAARNTTVGEAAGRLPGYYVLEEGKKGALPKYVYFGTAPPEGFS